jgi:hypothetical protein
LERDKIMKNAWSFICGMDGMMVANLQGGSFAYGGC